MESEPAKTVTGEAAEEVATIRPLSYMPQLDGLRAVAISLVLAGHFWSKAAVLSVPLAWLGVRLFFVLSGFLITKIILLQKHKIETGTLEKSTAIKTFYARRTLRLFPLYYTVLALALYFDVPMGRESWAWLVTYTSNFKMAISADWIGEFSHLWSLAAEEQFYLIWPWLIIFLKTRHLPWVITGVILSALLFRTAMVIDGESVFSHLLLFGVTDALGMGALLAVIANISAADPHYGRIRSWFFRSLPGMALVGLIGSVLLFTAGDWESASFGIWGTFFTSLPFAWLVWRSSSGFGGVAGRILSAPPVVYLGRISYGVYVIHAFVPSLLSKMNINPGNLPQGVEAWFIVITATTILIASASWFLLERPANRLKLRYKY